MLESPLVQVNIILSINFRFYQTIFRISLEQVQVIETSVAAQLLPPSQKLQQLPVHQLPALLPPSHQLQQLPGHQLPHLYLHTAPHHHLHPIHTGKSVIKGRTFTIVLANIVKWRLSAKTDIASALVKVTTMTLACVSFVVMITWKLKPQISGRCVSENFIAKLIGVIRMAPFWLTQRLCTNLCLPLSIVFI